MKTKTILIIIVIAALIIFLAWGYKKGLWSITKNNNQQTNMLTTGTKKIVSPGIAQGVSTSDLNAQLI